MPSRRLRVTRMNSSLAKWASSLRTCETNASFLIARDRGDPRGEGWGTVTPSHLRTEGRTLMLLPYRPEGSLSLISAWRSRLTWIRHISDRLNSTRVEAGRGSSICHLIAKLESADRANTRMRLFKRPSPQMFRRIGVIAIEAAAVARIRARGWNINVSGDVIARGIPVALPKTRRFAISGGMRDILTRLPLAMLYFASRSTPKSTDVAPALAPCAASSAGVAHSRGRYGRGGENVGQESSPDPADRRRGARREAASSGPAKVRPERRGGGGFAKPRPSSPRCSSLLANKRRRDRLRWRRWHAIVHTVFYNPRAVTPLPRPGVKTRAIADG